MTHVPAEYGHVTGRARWARRALAVVIVTNLVAIFFYLEELRLIDRAQSGRYVSASEAMAVDHRQLLALIVELVAGLFCGIAFIAWFHRSYKNLAPLGRETRHTTGWAIGYWFVPILNLFRPAQMTNELWRGSEPSVSAGESSVPALITLWWIAFLLTGVVARFASTHDSTVTSLHDLRSGDHVWVGFHVMSIVAALFAMQVVGRLTDRQEKRARAIGQALRAV
jgi:hypothetical protein